MFVFWRKSKESIIAPLIDEPQVFMGQHHRLPAGLLLSLCLCIVLFFHDPRSKQSLILKRKLLTSSLTVSPQQILLLYGMK